VSRICLSREVSWWFRQQSATGSVVIDGVTRGKAMKSMPSRCCEQSIDQF
jgi:hypothetical protein